MARFFHGAGAIQRGDGPIEAKGAGRQGRGIRLSETALPPYFLTSTNRLFFGKEATLFHNFENGNVNVTI